MNLRRFAAVHRLAAPSKVLFKYAKFLEPLREIKCNRVAVDLAFQLDLNFKSHRRVYASTSEVLWRDQIPHPIRASGDLLEDFQREPDRCLPRAVLSDQQNRRL